MEHYFIYYDHAVHGRIERKTEGLYSEFRAEFEAEEGTIYVLWLSGERGRFSLGVPEWNGTRYHLKKKVSNRDLREIGDIRCGLLCRKNAEQETEKEGDYPCDWIHLSYPEYFFKSMMPQLEGNRECYWKPAEQGRFLAVPIDNSTPFLLPRYFCFAKIQMIYGKSYAVFFFDHNDHPRMEN